MNLGNTSAPYRYDVLSVLAMTYTGVAAARQYPAVEHFRRRPHRRAVAMLNRFGFLARAARARIIGTMPS
jgi:hypothetical protein